MLDTEDIIEVDRSSTQKDETSDNTGPRIETRDLDISPQAHEAAKALLRKNVEFFITSIGDYETVQGEIRDQLIALGIQESIAEDLSHALAETAVERAEEFTNRHGSYIGITVTATDDFKPEMLPIDTGEVEIMRIGAADNQVTTTANWATTKEKQYNFGGSQELRAVDAVLNSFGEQYKGSGKAVIAGFVSATKSQVDAFKAEQNAAIGFAAELGLDMGPGATLQDVIDALQEAGQLTPELQALLENLSELASLAGSDLSIPEIADRIAELTSEIETQLQAAIENGTLSPAIMDATVEFVQTLGDKIEGFDGIVNLEAFSALGEKVEIAKLANDAAPELLAILQQLSAMDPADIPAELPEILKDLDVANLSAEDIALALQGYGDAALADAIQKAAMTLAEPSVQNALPAELQAAAVEFIAANSELVATLPPLETLTTLEAAAALSEVLQTLDSLDVDSLPPELAELLTQLEAAGVDITDANQLAQALAGEGDPAIADIVQDIVITLNNPEVQAALPQAVLNEVNIVLRDHADVVEAVTVQNVINSLQELVDNGNLSEAQIESIKETIAKLENGEGLEAITPEIMDAVKADATIQEMQALLDTGNLTAEQAQVIEQAIADLKSDTPMADIAPEALQIVEAQQAIETLNALLESGDLTAEQARDVSEAIAQLESGESIATLDQSVQDIIADNSQPNTPDVVQVVQSAQAENVVLANETIEKITDMSADIAVVQEALKSIDSPTAEQTELIQKLETIIETLKADPANIEALAELQSLDISKIADILPPDATDVIQNKVDRLTDSAAEITSIQETALSIKHDVAIVDIQNTAEVVAALNANADALQAAGVDIAVVKDALNNDITSTQSLTELAKAQNALVNASPDTVMAVSALMATQITEVAKDTGIDVAVVEQATGIVQALSSELNGNEALQQVLSDKGIDIDQVLTEIGTAEGLTAAAKLIAAAESSQEVAQALSPEMVESARAVMQAGADVEAAKIVAGSPNLNKAEVSAAIMQASEVAAAISVDPELRQTLEAAGVDTAKIDTIAKDIGSTDNLADIAKLATADNIPADIAAKAESIMDAKAEVIAAEIVAQNPDLSIEAVAASVADTAKLAAVAEQSQDLRQALEQAGMEPQQIDSVIQNLQDPTSVEALTAIETIKQAGPEAVAALESKGVDVAAVSEGQLNVQAARLDVEPTTLEAAVAVGAALSTDTNLQAAAEAAGIDLAEAKQMIEANPTSAEAIQTIMDLKEAAPAAAKAGIEALETQVIGEVASQLGMEASEVRDIINSSPEAKADILSKVEAVNNAPDTPATLDQAQRDAIVADLSNLDTNALSPQQADMVQDIADRVAAGQVVTEKEIAVAQATAELTSSSGNAGTTIQMPEAQQAQLAKTLEAVAEQGDLPDQTKAQLETITEKLNSGEGLSAADVATLKEVSQQTSGDVQMNVAAVVASAENAQAQTNAAGADNTAQTGNAATAGQESPEPVTQDSAAAKVQAETAARVSDFKDSIAADIANGNPPSGDQVNEMLRQADIAIATAQTDAAREQALANREAIVESSTGIDGVNQELRKGPSGHICDGECPCNTAFGKASGADGGENAPKSNYVVDHGDGSKTVISTDPQGGEPTQKTYTPTEVQKIEEQVVKTGQVLQKSGIWSAEDSNENKAALLTALRNNNSGSPTPTSVEAPPAQTIQNVATASLAVAQVDLKSINFSDLGNTGSANNGPSNSATTTAQNNKTVSADDIRNNRAQRAAENKPQTLSEKFAEAKTPIGKATVIAVAGLENLTQTMTKTFNKGCGGKTCGTCGACGTALQNVAATAVKHYERMAQLLGRAPAADKSAANFTQHKSQTSPSKPKTDGKVVNRDVLKQRREGRVEAAKPKSFSEKFAEATTPTGKAAVIAATGLQGLTQTITKSFNQGCGGKSCGTCGACGKALQRVAATAAKRFDKMGQLLGITPKASNNNSPSKFAQRTKEYGT